MTILILVKLQRLQARWAPDLECGDLSPLWFSEPNKAPTSRRTPKSGLRNLRITLLSFATNAFSQDTTGARYARLFAGRRAQTRIRHRGNQVGLRRVRIRTPGDPRRGKYRDPDGQVR